MDTLLIMELDISVDKEFCAEGLSVFPKIISFGEKGMLLFPDHVLPSALRKGNFCSLVYNLFHLIFLLHKRESADVIGKVRHSWIVFP